jgi:hypothetical protein
MKLKKPSPALVVATAALFAALSGTAVAGSNLVQRALFADRVASVLNDVTVRTANGNISGGDDREFFAGCRPGERALAGGWTASPEAVFSLDDHPTDTENFRVETWAVRLLNVSEQPAHVTVYVTCAR